MQSSTQIAYTSQPVTIVQSAPALTAEEIEHLRGECKKMVRRRALLSAASSFIPIPGIDLITDTAVLVRLIPEINEKFRLNETQNRAPAVSGKLFTFRLLATAGAMFSSRVVTASVVIGVLRAAGLRMTLMEAARIVPIAGQIVAAVLGYLALSHVAGKHVDECAALAHEMRQVNSTR